MLFSLQSLSAQSVRGELVEQGTGYPIEGAFVVLEGDDGIRVAGALTDRTGAFVLQAPSPGRYKIEAERIGYESFSSAVVSLASGQVLDYRLAMPILPVELAALSVEGERQCEIRPPEGRRVARVWEEARKALTAAVWTEEQRAFRFTTRLHQSKLDPETLRVLEEKAEILSGLSTNPFRALPPEELAENGYTRTLSADTVEYYAPDASVLLSDPFVDDHCFRVVEGTGDTQGMIGLEFEPLLRDDRTEISGVLWLDRSDAHLQFIQYRYENLRSGFRSDKVGGRIDFRRLPGGAWIVDDWYIRMPVFELVTVTERSGPAVPGNRSHTRQEHRLGFLTEQGGQVLMVADESGHIADAQSASRTGRGVVAGEVFDSTANAPLQGATVSLLGTNLRTTTDEAGRYTLEDLPVGNFHVTFSHPKMRLLEPGAVYRPVRVRQGTVARVDLAVPSTNVLLQSLCPDESGQSGTAVVGTITEAGTGRPSVGAVVRLSSHILGILAASAETLTEDDRSDSGLGVPASAAHYEAVADENGGFRICGVPAGLRAYMTAFANESGPHAGADVVYFTVPDGIYMTTLEIPSAASRPEGS